ncbi:TIGR04282 family arsenosugar biosynthesis glycosyltransferase [Pseudozobellia thermophila]|uniref:Glycosyltransferase n=1 Tax=Pseudozobellia thermophila TaxID=192903 RepID=A0A1M6D2T9_9FLAO|nr:TIGR04282 family arsenosugar biosynthesis glycosyltransferase [Pseudozobellia thermophila]SHI67615.1 hypothetical protein SAMN04488513_101964 [Pseudozobellia thermophila]
MFSIPLPNENQKETPTINFTNLASKDLLIIFTRNPELGKCKTRLASTVGARVALEIYNFLLAHTVSITQHLNVAKQVWYSEEIWEDDVWNGLVYEKRLQEGPNLGTRMANAFQAGFKSGYERIIIIGSDMYDLEDKDIAIAFEQLKVNNFVIGPADDGGYYLLGMTRFKPELFEHKHWGRDTVLKDTLENLKNESYHMLDMRNDIDLYEDIKDIDVFQPFLKQIEK